MAVCNWEEYHMKEAELVSTRSKDPSSQVGAVIVDFDNQQIVRGWNGFPRNIYSISEEDVQREIKYQYIVHAEMNCIYNAARRGVSIANATIYVFGVPTCFECAKALIQVGIIRVVGLCKKSQQTEKWIESYKQTIELFKEADIICEMKYV